MRITGTITKGKARYNIDVHAVDERQATEAEVEPIRVTREMIAALQRSRSDRLSAEIDIDAHGNTSVKLTVGVQSIHIEYGEARTLHRLMADLFKRVGSKRRKAKRRT